jgi:hypothetical protein
VENQIASRDRRGCTDSLNGCGDSEKRADNI